MTNSRIIKDQSSMGQFSSAIAQICDEKGIDKDKVLLSIEAALAAAYKKDYGKKGQIILANMDEKTSDVKFRQFKEVVDETTRTIDDEYIPEEVHNVPENAIKSEEKIERHKTEYHEQTEDGEEISLPKFNSERDVLLEDVKKVIKDIKVGDYIEIALEGQDQYGRIASQTAKQVIIQKIREAEREAMYEEFKGKEGEVISGTVQRVEGGRVFVDLGKSVGILFPSDQIPGEEYRMGQRLKLYIDKVDSSSRSVGINLSRKHPQLLAKLFELEVPEIFTGSIEIKSVAREAGNRSKIAVVSNEDGLDPIGSCVGQKGTRVQAIIDELNGEKIDIIEWVDDPEKMIAQALAPAKVIKVELVEKEETEVNDEDKAVDESDKKDKDIEDKEIKEEEKENSENNGYKKAIAYVKDDQLSLAIGRRGQNVRLAAKLTGWNINVEAINSEDENADEEPQDSDDKTKDKKEEKSKKDVKIDKEKEEKVAGTKDKEQEEEKEVKKEKKAGEKKTKEQKDKKEKDDENKSSTEKGVEKKEKEKKEEVKDKEDKKEE